MVTDGAPRSQIERTYLERTTGSAQLMERAGRSLPGGSTRSFGYFDPYPLVFDRGEGPYLRDVDGNRYVDLTYNGLSLIHGHAYPPVKEALASAIPSGTAWPGTSRAQIEFAEALRDRIETAELIRFTNTGTEATMLGVKIARHVTGRPLLIKSMGAYHGSYDDLEAGLYGIGELPGRTLLGAFGDLESYERAFAEHGDEIAAVVIEPILFTFRVVPPPPGFLSELAELARKHGALVVLDDCLMFRLAVGGSAEKYGVRPDITCLGKFIGGGLPVGVVAGSQQVMRALDPSRDDSFYHGGSFNGNPLGCAAGKVTLEELTAARISEMDDRTARLREALVSMAADSGIELDVSSDGSVLGSYVLGADGEPDPELGRLLLLAGINHGVYSGQDGEMAMATSLDDAALELVISGFGSALKDLAAELELRGAPA